MSGDRRLVFLLLTGAGLSGIVGLFLPVTWNQSPLVALWEAFVLEGGGGLWRIALPFTVSILIFAASLRWLVTGTFSRIEQVITFSTSLTYSSLVLPIWIDWLRFPREADGWVFLLVPPVTIIAGVYLALRTWTSWGASSCSPVVALQVSYLGNCVIVLSVIVVWEPGAWCALVTATTYLLYIALATQIGAFSGKLRDLKH